jgi:ribosomal protein L11 methyltransferase
MDYVEVHCRLNPMDPWRDILIAQLAEIGFESFEETLEGFKAFIPALEYREDLLGGTMELPGAGPELEMSYQVQVIGGRNWNQVWESHFDPVWITERLFVRAPFHKPARDAEFEIIIEPKMSFGTGHHETTSLMVEWLLETKLKGKSLLDMGCGTGILAILGAKKGAAPVMAIDNNIYAYENTLENAERNGMSMIDVQHGDTGVLWDDTFDVILANITKNILLEDMGKYLAVLNPKGVMILSGFLEMDKGDIVAHAASLGLHFTGEKRKKDWIAVKLVKD